MNKILQINLGGYALTIDEDAHQHLSAYLDDIRLQLSHHEGRDEIMRDIEMRLGELLSERLGARTIVSLADVEAAVEVMGKPEDFGSETSGATGSKSSHAKAFRPGRRFYRDENDAVIGGVCSGLAAYLGLNDPVWVRIVFVLLALISFGFWMPAYVLLWILVPPARTAAERLAMRGEMPNVENIVREAEQGAERFARKAEAFGQAAGSKVKAVSPSLAAGCASFFTRFLRGVAIFVALGLVLGLGTVWVAGTIAFFTGQPSIALLSPLPIEASYVGFLNLFFLIGIPVLWLSLWLLRTIFRFQAPAWLGAGMAVLWLLNFISIVALATWGATQYRREGSFERTIDFSSMTSDTLFLRLEETTSTSSGRWQWTFAPGRGGCPAGVLSLVIERSESEHFEGSYTLYVRGASEAEAQAFANKLPFKAVLSGRTLTLPRQIALSEGGWLMRQAIVRVRVPEGKYIVFEEGVHRCVGAYYADEAYVARNNPGKAFQMTAFGLVCAHCAPDDYGDQEDKPVEHFRFEGSLNVDIVYDEKFSIYYPDNRSDASRISAVRHGHSLVLSAAEAEGKAPIRCIVHTPVFTSLVVKGQGQISIQGFEEGKSSIAATGPVHVRGLYQSEHLRVTLDDKARLDLLGEGHKLEAFVSNGAMLKASSWPVEAANVVATNYSEAYINAQRTDVRADASSKVFTVGSGAVQHF